MARYSVIVAAAGRSERFGKAHKKQFAKIQNRPLLIRAVESFVNRDEVCQVLLAVAPEDVEEVKSKFGANLGFMGVNVVEGGVQRWQTVGTALAAVSEEAEYVAVHDVARICVTADMIDRVFAEATKSGAAILAAPLTGTVKSVTPERVIDKTVPREGLYEAQTPQVFKKELLREAYESAAEHDGATDDAAVLEAAGHAVTVVVSDASNLKITVPGDLSLAEAILKSRPRHQKSKPFGAFEEAQW